MVRPQKKNPTTCALLFDKYSETKYKSEGPSQVNSPIANFCCPRAPNMAKPILLLLLLLLVATSQARFCTDGESKYTGNTAFIARYKTLFPTQTRPAARALAARTTSAAPTRTPCASATPVSWSTGRGSSLQPKEVRLTTIYFPLRIFGIFRAFISAGEIAFDQR